MNYDNPELLDRLAAEYVLGTLRGPARRRFERLLWEQPAARAAVDSWQSRLSGLAEALPSTAPPARVWMQLEQAISPGAKAPPRSTLWRNWALLASAACAVLLTLLALPPPTAPEAPQQVAFVNEANVTPLWVVSIDFATGELVTRAVSAQAQAIDKSYELWMLSEQGVPRSLGLMPVAGDATSQRFSPALLDLLKRAQGLAVSIEPAGGSPTGQPTGPVVYQAPLLEWL